MFPLECVQDLDCQKRGQHFECNSYICTCVSGYALYGDACVGMLPEFLNFALKFKCV